MRDLMTPSTKEVLWHKMRQDLANYLPEGTDHPLLMCCACGRFLPQTSFDLEHLIPQQALKGDPNVVRMNPATPANVRAGNLLFCKTPLKLEGKIRYNSGCNSWKGRRYDKMLSELINANPARSGQITEMHIIAALNIAYLAMVAKFGYIVALMPSGVVMRKQFFSPHKYHHELPIRSRIMLAGTMPIISPDALTWATLFSFGFQNMACAVATRNFAVNVPVTRDPRVPIARHLRIVPVRYKLRPDFRTAFD